MKRFFKSLLLFSTCLFVFTSCIGVKKLIAPHTDQSTSRFEKHINGVYANIDTTTANGNASLINVLYEKQNVKFSDNWADLRVHLLYEDRKLYVKSYAGDSLVYENEIWGHIHEDRFVSNRKFLLIPLLLFNVQKESRQILYIDENRMLHATNRGYYYWFMPFGNGAGGSDNYLRFGQFKKVSELPNPFE